MPDGPDTTGGPPNVYQDRDRAQAYARLGLTGTYYLAYRDLPELIARHAPGARTALDFGCGAGRSSRLLGGLGLHVTGIDVSGAMLAQARAADPDGDYLLIEDDGRTGWPDGPFDVALAAFPFDNIGPLAHRVRLMRAIAERLAGDGVFVLVASAPEFYTREWLSHSTDAFRDENARRTSGEVVRVVITEGGDERPVEDLLWTDADNRSSLAAAGFDVVEVLRPLGRAGEPFAWGTEAEVSPWLVYACRLTRG